MACPEGLVAQFQQAHLDLLALGPHQKLGQRAEDVELLFPGFFPGLILRYFGRK
jgi:hypothetical protein